MNEFCGDASELIRDEGMFDLNLMLSLRGRLKLLILRPSRSLTAANFDTPNLLDEVKATLEVKWLLQDN